MKCLLFCLFAAMSVLAAAQTPIPLTGGGVGDPAPPKRWSQQSSHADTVFVY